MREDGLNSIGWSSDRSVDTFGREQDRTLDTGLAAEGLQIRLQSIAILKRRKAIKRSDADDVSWISHGPINSAIVSETQEFLLGRI